MREAGTWLLIGSVFLLLAVGLVWLVLANLALYAEMSKVERSLAAGGVTGFAYVLFHLYSLEKKVAAMRAEVRNLRLNQGD